MPMQSPWDLFVYELSAVYALEQFKSRALPHMEQTCQNPQIKQLFGKEIPETQQQITRLQECFRLLGEQPMNVTPHAITCLQQDVQQFVQQNPPQELQDLYSLGIATRADNYEIASYTSLVEMARPMGQTQVASLLEENLRDEQSSARQMEQLERQIASQAIQRVGP